MSVETHISVFITEAEEAYKKAVAGVGELWDKMEALKAKYEHDLQVARGEIDADVKTAEEDLPAIEAEAKKLENSTSNKDTIDKA